MKSHCKHWRGSVEDICDAGLNWREITGGEMTGIMRRCPCVNGNQPVSCDKFEAYTEEELRQIEQETEELFAQTVKEFPYWDQLKSRHPRGAQGTCECPRCGGACRFSIASCNGHLHVRCRTDGCISFME